MARSRNVLKSSKGKFTRGQPRENTRAAAAPTADKLHQRTAKLPPNQKQAIEDLELGQRYAGRSFKRHKSTSEEKPTVRRRPPMPNESTRTDLDRRGGRTKN